MDPGPVVISSRKLLRQMAPGPREPRRTSRADFGLQELPGASRDLRHCPGRGRGCPRSCPEFLLSATRPARESEGRCCLRLASLVPGRGPAKQTRGQSICILCPGPPSAVTDVGPAQLPAPGAAHPLSQQTVPGPARPQECPKPTAWPKQGQSALCTPPRAPCEDKEE